MSVVKLKVRIEYKNENLETVLIKTYPIEDYCNNLSQSLCSLLYMIEDYSQGQIEFTDIRRRVLNVAGEIRRLPQNILKE